MSDYLRQPTKSFWAGTIRAFLEEGILPLTGELARRVGLTHAGNEIQQIKAWERQIEIIRAAFLALNGLGDDWGVLLELPLLRLGRRLDAIILARSTVVVVEFKIGGRTSNKQDILQTEDYALCLRDFHSGAAGHLIVPVLCIEDAPFETDELSGAIDSLAPTILCNAKGLAPVLMQVASQHEGFEKQLSWLEFDSAAYSPTPSIIDAAKAVYSGHSVVEIGRSDAHGDRIKAACDRLQQIARTAEEERKKVICFVTGTPGAGKTLLGLNLVFAESRAPEQTRAALLSGNRPLVYVLQEALAEDAAERHGGKAEARRRAQAGIQNLLGYLKEHAHDAEPPPERVVVFDEAQRAWDEETGNRLLGRRRSEPRLFLDIMGRLPWACLVCLLGPGQEINKGEGGLSLWSAELRAAAAQNEVWEVHASPLALREGTELSRLHLTGEMNAYPICEEPLLHLQAGLRAYRNILHNDWVEALLSDRVGAAAGIARSMASPPALVTRDLDALRCWLAARQRGGRRAGMLASSGSVRIVADGIPPSPRSDDLSSVAHWFLRPTEDFRSSNSLEIPLSEFVCQGLEIDYAGLCWGGDLIWGADHWSPRMMRAPRWQTIRQKEKASFRINAYRVLLTRARLGLAIFVPKGSAADPTRQPAEFDGIFGQLVRAGCEVIPS